MKTSSKLLWRRFCSRIEKEKKEGKNKREKRDDKMPKKEELPEAGEGNDLEDRWWNYRRLMVRVNKETPQQQVLRSKLYMNSIKKERNQSIEVLDSLIFWGSLHFVDKNGNLAKSKNIMPNYSCAPFLTHQVS